MEGSSCSMHAMNSVNPCAPKFAADQVRFEVDLIRMNEFHHAPAAKSQLRELLFRISVALKGLHAVLEIVGGIRRRGFARDHSRRRSGRPAAARAARLP